MRIHFQKYTLSHWVAIAMAGQLLLGPAWGQTTGFLRVTIVEGEGAFNDMKHKTSHPPVVKVVDESNNLVKGAEVTCTLPAVGAGGVFDDGTRVAKAVSDETGMARCPSYKPNNEEGRFNVKLTALFQGKTGSLVISQSNTTAGGTAVGEQKKGKGLLILLLVAGGAAGGIIAATSKSGSSGPVAPPPTTLSAGTITVGGPR